MSSVRRMWQSSFWCRHLQNEGRLTREKWKRLKDEVLSQFLISNMSIDNYAFSESHVIDFERIRQSHPLVAYCEDQGIDLRRSSNRRVGKCPLHNEQNGTAFVLHPDEKWQCFGKCSRQGDVVDLEMLLHSGTLAEAGNRLHPGRRNREPSSIVRFPAASASWPKVVPT